MSKSYINDVPRGTIENAEVGSIPGEDYKPDVLYSISGSVLVVCNLHPGHRNLGNFSVTGRTSIEGLTETSRKRMGKYLRSCVAQYTAMVTLTYPFTFPGDGAECKKHLHRFIQELRRYYAQINVPVTRVSIFWFLEFQSRGAPHFHLFVTQFVPAKWIAETWYRIVGSDDDRHLRAGTNVCTLVAGREGACAYARKYARKAEQKDVPANFANVGRFWGVAGLRCIVVAATRVTPEYFFFEDFRALKARLDAYITMCVSRGKLRYVRKEEGVRVLICADNHTKEMLHVKIQFLEAYIQRKWGHSVGKQVQDAIFLDAELT